MPKRVLKVFVGYQIKSRFHSSSCIKRVLAKKLSSIIKKQRDVFLEFQFGDRFNAGEFLFSQVQSAITDCEIAIFDISENNPNVMIEVGMALGAKKFTIILKNEASGKEFPVPSDIKAFIYVPYKKMEGVVQATKTAILNYIKNLTPSHLYFRQLWGFNPGDVVYLVCPELEEPDSRQHPEPNEFLYLGKYGDIDALITLFSTLSKLYPNITLRICTGKEFKAYKPIPNSENLILLGGPDYNEITRHYMKNTRRVPYKFIDAGDESEAIKLPRGYGMAQAAIEMDDSRANGIDYGFFVRFQNPHNKKKTIIMVNGIHTYGVYGAAKCFALNQDGETDVSTENCKKILSKIGKHSKFGVHFKLQIMQNEVATPVINPKDVIKL